MCIYYAKFSGIIYLFIKFYLLILYVQVLVSRKTYFDYPLYN